MRRDQVMRASLGALLGSCALLLVIMGCGKIDRALDQVDKAIDAFEKARDSAVSQSDAWRAALPKLVDQLNGLEGQAAADSKAIIADARNQAQELMTESVKFANINAQEIIAKTGVEFRCNANFGMSGVSARLQYVIDDLKFWKKTKHHLDKKPAHVLCQIVGDTLSLHPVANNGFTIDSTKLIGLNLVGVFGYNFRADALPRLELTDSSGKHIRDMPVLPAYVTQYQLMIDFSAEAFTGSVPSGRIRLVWPDGGEPNDISLSIINPAKLRIVNHVFTPGVATMRKDAVKLSVTVQNIGGERSGGFTLKWAPPDGGRVQALSQLALNAKESRQAQFTDAVVYQTAGQKGNIVSISGGDDTETFLVQVAPAPPVFVHTKLLLFWDHFNPRVLYVVDRHKSEDHMRESNKNQASYIKDCCAGVFNADEYKNLKNMPALPNISRQERNQKACIRDEHIIQDPQKLGLAPVHQHWPEVMDDELWFIVEGDHLE